MKALAVSKLRKLKALSKISKLRKLRALSKISKLRKLKALSKVSIDFLYLYRGRSFLVGRNFVFNFFYDSSS